VVAKLAGTCPGARASPRRAGRTCVGEEVKLVRTHVTGRWWAAGGSLAAVAACLVLAAPPAAADLAEPAGACAGTAAWRDAGVAVDSAAADPADVVEIPRRDVVEWSGRVAGPEPGAARPVAGAVGLLLPPPIGLFPVNRWDGPATAVAAAGAEAYDLPALVPAGVVFTLGVEHREDGEVFCTGTAHLRIAGGAFDSPLIWVGVVGVLLFGGLLLAAGRAAPGAGRPRAGRMALGALVGVLLAAFAALTLVLFGVVPLASPLLTVAPLVGLAAGVAWSRWAPLGAAKVGV
jgi:hypothetical protein